MLVHRLAEPKLNSTFVAAGSRREAMDILTTEADDDDDDAARKRVKLDAAPPSCFHCGAAPATNRCSRCKAVHFCSRACQQSAWPQHRRTCAPPKRSWADGAALWARALRESSGPPRGGRARCGSALNQRPDGAAGATFLGYCRSDAGDAGGAAAHLERAVALDPSNGDAWRELPRRARRGRYNRREGRRRAPWWDGASFPWVAALEAMSGEVRAEAAALVDAETWSDVGGQGRGPSGAHDGAVVDGSWREVVLLGAGAVEGAAPATARGETACPTRRALRFRGGEVILSRLAPRSAIRPHCAPTNLRLTCHLGLAVPPGGGCRIRWRRLADLGRGRCLLFDDSFEHEVRNDTDRARVVLLLRFFHPDLAPERRGAACRDAIEAKAAAERAHWAPPD
ncbi:peptide-aspartate beta-dioxygenase [Aureococcus anophagefferens]|nr:peptide-aspartate beta-dioxygenase [Aureococcus anophagefferens]